MITICIARKLQQRNAGDNQERGIWYLVQKGLTAMNQGKSKHSAEEFALGIDPKSLHAMVLMQTVYNAVVQHSEGF